MRAETARELERDESEEGVWRGAAEYRDGRTGQEARSEEAHEVTWRAFGLLCLVPLLAGCLKDQQQQLVKCGAEKIRPEAGPYEVRSVDSEAYKVRLCMIAAGYEFYQWFDFCHSNRRPAGYEVTDFCYRPEEKNARFWTDFEISVEWVH